MSKKRKVEVDERKIVVHEMTLAMSLREQSIRLDVLAKPHKDPFIQHVRNIFYPLMIACSTGNVPTEKEFLAMPTRQIEDWYKVVAELNPDAHSIEEKDEPISDEDLKKNEQ